MPSEEEVTASMTAAHAAVAALDVGAADALWHVLTNVNALLKRAKAERLGIARAVTRLQVCFVPTSSSKESSSWTRLSGS